MVKCVKSFLSVRATIGEVGNAEHMLRQLGKAGATRWRGIRPTVRGVVMNPVDHPHGGGEGKNIGWSSSCVLLGVYQRKATKLVRTRVLISTLFVVVIRNKQRYRHGHVLSRRVHSLTYTC